jgi:parallel beta-helix repeat protein
MQKNSLALLLGLTLLLGSCNKKDEEVNPNAPRACFTVPGGDKYTMMGIAFNAECSNRAQSHHWDFGDGEFSSLPSPSHAYDKAGSYKVTLKVIDEAQQTHVTSQQVAIKASPYTQHSGYIDQPEVWKAGGHLVTGNVHIRHGSLTIEPGATIYLNKETSIYVGHRETVTAGGALFTANGTASQPIVFKPASNLTVPGEWGNLFFTDKASGNASLQHCQVLYGGKAGQWSYDLGMSYYSYGVVHVHKTGLRLENTTVTGAAHYGASLGEYAHFTSFTGNTFSGNTSYPVYIHINNVHTIGAGNQWPDSKGIFVFGQTFQQLQATWKKQDVPYVLNSEKWISGGTAGPANLRIEAGTTIALTKGASIRVGLYGPGNLYAEGTAESPIVFTSAETTKSRGDWVYIESSNGSIFRHCRFEYGGGEQIFKISRTLEAGGNSIVTNCTVSESGGIGIKLGSIDQMTFENNTITGCNNYGLTLPASSFHLLNANNTIQNSKGLRLEAAAITGAVTWPKRQYPVTVSGTIAISNATGVSLTIAPGSTLYFTTSAISRLAAKATTRAPSLPTAPPNASCLPWPKNLRPPAPTGRASSSDPALPHSRSW